ncbi:antitoxin [Methylocaldum gracile]|jgi:antitoxin VapB
MSKTAKIFMSGRSQADRLPLEFRFDCKEVYIEKQGDSVILRPKPDTLADQWHDFFESSEPFPDDFLADRMDTPPQERKWFDDVDA